MDKPLTLNDIDEKVKNKIYTQKYNNHLILEGVKLIDLKTYVGEEGDFGELIRTNDKGEIEELPGFKIAQINRTKLFPGSIKAWHLHFKQNEIWYVSPHRSLFVGLWDVRKNSSTVDQKSRIILGGGYSKLLFIPKGIAHGLANFSSANVELYYFMDQQFNSESPDEQRIDWDIDSKDFWSPKID